MKNTYIPSKHFIGVERCWENITSYDAKYKLHEYTLLCENGQVYEYASYPKPALYACIISNAETANKLARKFKKRTGYKDGEECWFTFAPSQLECVLNALRIIPALPDSPPIKS